jgi:hypothetical protein
LTHSDSSLAIGSRVEVAHEDYRQEWVACWALVNDVLDDEVKDTIFEASEVKISHDVTSVVVVGGGRD